MRIDWRTGTKYWAWYDFSDSNSIVLDGSSKISTIFDKSGKGHHATQSTPSMRPAVGTLHGLSAGSFVSANKTELLSTGWSPLLPYPFTISVVWTQTVASSSAYQPGPFGGLATPPPPILFDIFDNSRLQMQVGANGFGPSKSAPYSQQLATLIFNGSSSVFRLNGSASSGTTDVYNMPNISLGTCHSPDSTGVNNHMDGLIGELIVQAGVLTSAQITAVESYLKAKWGTP